MIDGENHSEAPSICMHINTIELFLKRLIMTHTILTLTIKMFLLN